MKKSLLALAVLGVFAGAASAQSSVTIYGKIDQSVGKNLGTKNKEVFDNAGSRIGFLGNEDLGGGNRAIFGFEHRFQPDTGKGNSASGTVMWEGFSWVGLRSASLGTVTIGRQYTSAFLNVQNAVDPFAGEGVGALRNIGSAISSGVARVRADNDVKYANVFGPVTVSVDVNESSGAAGAKKPYSLAVSGTIGPVWAGLAYENPESVSSDVLNLAARAKFGDVTVSGMFTTGSLTAATDVTAMLVGAKVAMGAADLKVGYATRKHETSGVSTTANQKLGLGVDYNLSKRTKAYVQYGRDGKVATEKAGYEVGVQHNF